MCVFFSFEVKAQIFKCMGADGKIVYQQVKCANASELNVIKNQKDAPVEEQIRAYERHQNILELNRKAAEEEQLDKRRREKNHQEILEAEKKKREAADAQMKMQVDAIEKMRARQLEERSVQALEDIARGSNRRLHCRPDGIGGAYCN